jgi:hypothetical protein
MHNQQTGYRGPYAVFTFEELKLIERWALKSRAKLSSSIRAKIEAAMKSDSKLRQPHS